jgi:8-oxo-dGTP diphosphatase
MKKTLDPKKDVIEAAGGLVWRDGKSEREIAIIHRPAYDDWTLPKGKRDPDESWQETAVREVWEETGCKVEIENFAGALGYTVNGVAKVVLFWNMRSLEEENFTPNAEVDQLVWLPLSKAFEMVSYPDEIGLLKANQTQNRPRK